MSPKSVITKISARFYDDITCVSKRVCPSIRSPNFNASIIIGKKVEVSLRLFDIFQRNMDFNFLYKKGEALD